MNKVLPNWVDLIANEVKEQLHISSLTDVIAEQLRSWELSEVWRLSVESGLSVIAKHGSGEMAIEATLYSSLLGPLKVHTPKIYITRPDGDSVIILMEDLGQYTLEQNGSPAAYAEAIIELAKMRVSAASQLRLPDLIQTSFYRGVDDYIDIAERAQRGLASYRPDLASSLDTARAVIPDALQSLYAGVKPTIVHGDLHAKNLIYWHGQITPIDWTHAYIGPDLSDLYCLIREADDHNYNAATKKLPAIYEKTLQTLGGQTDIPVAWQMHVGGLCWTLSTLRWIVEEGLTSLPMSADWIDGLVTDAVHLARQLSK